MAEDLEVYEENVRDVLEDIEKYLEEANSKSGRGKLDVNYHLKVYFHAHTHYIT